MQEKITLGGGCFWCLEATFKQVKGVINVTSGYADGQIENPSYEQICTGTTGHAEVVQISFDNDIVDSQSLLMIFFATHDPTTLNRQGGDSGTQYRSIILADNAEQLTQAEQMIAQLEENARYGDPIVTQVKMMPRFYKAEQYHQDYFQLNPNSGYCQAIIAPKLQKLTHDYASYLK
jgi:peptide-methionine (S)-S-oxide reductase